MDKKNLYIIWGFVSAFLSLTLGFIAMEVNPWCGLFVVPVVGFIAYNVIKAAK